MVTLLVLAAMFVEAPEQQVCFVLPDRMTCYWCLPNANGYVFDCTREGP